MREEAASPTTGFGNHLLDLNGFDLADLDRPGDSSLDLALRRILDEENIGPVAGFDSAI
jgi:FXSXX-COOH protein